jgi:YHS domain-containing protein
LNRALQAAVLLAAAALAAGCSALVAQNPATPMQPVNAVRNGDDASLMVRGYDVVSYVVDARAVPGLPQFRTQFDGVTYHFASAEHLALFLREPARYQPSYHGYDAMRMVFAIPEPADPTVWSSIDGRVFLFADAESKAAFELDTAGNAALADKYWKSEVAGSNSAWQGILRRFDRVAHYRSRDELARAVAAAKAKPG